MNQSKTTYVIIEPYKKYDFYITPWSSFLSKVEDVMDAAEPGEPVTMRFTVKEFTEEEYERFCEVNEVERD